MDVNNEVGTVYIEKPFVFERTLVIYCDKKGLLISLPVFYAFLLVRALSFFYTFLVLQCKHLLM